jgi:hypothetical protein
MWQLSPDLDLDLVAFSITSISKRICVHWHHTILAVFVLLFKMKLTVSFLLLSLFATFRVGLTQTVRPTNAGRAQPDAKPSRGARKTLAPVIPSPTNAPVPLPLATVSPTVTPHKPINPPRAPGSTSKPRGRASPTAPSLPPAPLASRISVASDGTLAVVDPNGVLYISYDGMSFSVLVSGGVKDAAVVSKTQLWYVDTSGVLYYQTGGTPAFATVGTGGYTFVGAASNGHFIVVKSDGTLYYSFSYGPSPMIGQVTGVSNAIRAAIDLQYVYYITNTNDLYQTDGNSPGGQVGSSALEVSASSVDSTVIMNLIANPPNNMVSYGLYKKTDLAFTQDFVAIQGSALQSAVIYSNSGYIITTSGQLQATKFS